MDPLPCPFCGCARVSFHPGFNFRWIVLSCDGCGANCGETRVQTSGSGTQYEWLDNAKQRAMVGWNTRTPTVSR